MACCNITSKLFLGVLSLVYWAVGVGLIFVGVWIFSHYQHVEQITRANLTLIPASVIIGTGIITFILGLIGCVAAFKENRCLLATFFVILMIIIMGMVVAAVLGYVFRLIVGNYLKSGLQDAVNHYDDKDKTLHNEIDFIQSNLKCCGVQNVTDWKNWSVKHDGKLPATCCVNNNINCTTTSHAGNSTTVYQQGCFAKLNTLVRSNLAIIISVAISMAVIQLLGIICTCILFCRSGSDVSYIGLQEERGYRV